MPHVPLSEPTLKRLEILFSGEELKIATELLENECGSNLLFCENYGPVEMERLRLR